MIKSILQEDVIETNVKLETWQEVAKRGCELLEAKGLINSAFYQTILDVIEQYGPYMILVPEVCFFHGVPGPNVKSQCLSMITLAEPVYFREYANQKISCAFVFGAVDKESHMQMIMDLAALLQDSEFIEMITHNADKKDILAKISKIDKE